MSLLCGVNVYVMSCHAYGSILSLNMFLEIRMRRFGY